MAKNKQRVDNNLEKFGQYIGPKVINGKIVPRTESELLQHLFWVKSRDNENAVGQMVPGNLVEGMIKNDSYDIQYVGNQREPGEYAERLKELTQEQSKDLAQGRKRKLERFGIFEPETKPEPEVSMQDLDREMDELISKTNSPITGEKTFSAKAMENPDPEPEVVEVKPAAKPKAAPKRRTRKPKVEKE